MDPVKSEKEIERKILLTCNKRGTRLFKNETGRAYRGNVTRSGKGVVISPAYMIQYGLCVGSSDLIGIQKVKITQDMVGEELGIFCAFEVKTEKGRASDEQLRFIEMVKNHGGISCIVRNPEDVDSALQEFSKQYQE